MFTLCVFIIVPNKELNILSVLGSSSIKICYGTLPYIKVVLTKITKSIGIIVKLWQSLLSNTLRTNEFLNNCSKQILQNLRKRTFLYCIQSSSVSLGAKLDIELIGPLWNNRELNALSTRFLILYQNKAVLQSLRKEKPSLIVCRFQAFLWLRSRILSLLTPWTCEIIFSSILSLMRF